MATKGWLARADSSWTWRERRSFPTPLSPVTSSVVSTFATRRARSITWRIARLRATIPAASSATPLTRDSSRCFDRRRRSVVLSRSVIDLVTASRQVFS